MSTEEQRFYKEVAEGLMKQQGIDPKKWRENEINQAYQLFVMENRQALIHSMKPEKPNRTMDQREKQPFQETNKQKNNQ